MNQKANLRLATAADLPEAYQLVCEMQEKILDKAAFEKIFIDQLVRADVRIWVAEAQGRTVGLLVLHFHDHLHHAGKIAEVVELAVEPSHRSQGIGSRLLAQAEIAAIQEGCQVLELSTSFRRVDAHRFYEREGLNKTHYKFTRNLQP